MTGQMIFGLPAVCFACVAIFSGFVSGAPITVTDQKGRAIEIEPVSIVNDSFTFRRAGKEFTLPIGNFADASQELIRKEVGRIRVVFPKIQPEIIIGKRRQRADTKQMVNGELEDVPSDYLVKQEITCTIKLTNPSNATPVPPISGKIVFMGQDRRAPELIEILSSQAVDASIMPGGTFVKEMESFVTSYDSDKKGIGNIGGSQYIGYLLVLLSEAGDVVLDQTTTASFRQAISDNPSVLKELLKQPKGKLLTKNLNPSPIAENSRLRP